jgi:tetratricopeptide (TPR) repeat protein
MASLKSQAIQTALVGDWHNALTLNQSILLEDPDDIDTLNRLGFAYLSLGNTKEAKEVYEKVLSLDMKNPIALRNLKRLNENQTKVSNIPLNNLFIEEPGKTKVMELLNIADKKVVAYLRSGELIDLRIKRNRIFAINSENQFIGMLPDDICQRLIKFINAGNLYEAYIRTVDNNRVSVFVRETKRVKKFRDQPSFVNNIVPRTADKKKSQIDESL